MKDLAIKLVSCCLLIGSVIGFNQAMALGKTGHRVTGKIAEHFLSEQSKRQIAAIIGNESLASVSNYADEMRSSPDEYWQKKASALHYTTVKKGEQYNIETASAKGDVITALRDFRAILLDPKAPLADKQLALKFTVHLIGDLHQPLHVGFGTDRGGNDFKVEFFGKESNLHRVWDSGLIDRQQLSFTEWADWSLRQIGEAELKAWSSTDPIDWLKESQSIRNDIYPKDPKISWRYQFNHLPTLKRRLNQAGVRMALYLNAIFDNKPAK